MGQLIITRSKNFSYSVRAFNVVLNNQVIGSIKNGETVSINLNPGSYSLQIAIDMYRSETLQFEIDDSDVSFETGIRSGLMGALSAFTSTQGYIYLKQTSGTAAVTRVDQPVLPQQEAVPNPPPKPPEQETKRNAIFVSYRRQDAPDTTGRIYDHLVQRFGRGSVFKDVDSIPLGVDFRKHLDKSVGKCCVMLAVIGDNWHDKKGSAGTSRLLDERDFVRIEIESALKRDIPVIPLLVRGAAMPKESELPDSLKELSYRNGIPVRPDPDFHHDMERLMDGLEEML